MHYLDEKQTALCEAAAKVEECFSDDGTAPQHLIDEILVAGFLYKTKSRKTPYMFTDAGCIAVELWNANFRLTKDGPHKSAIRNAGGSQ